MKIPKTVRGYISLMKTVDRISPPILKNYDKLSTRQKYLLRMLHGGISNDLSEFLEKYEKKEQQ